MRQRNLVTARSGARRLTDGGRMRGSMDSADSGTSDLGVLGEEDRIGVRAVRIVRWLSGIDGSSPSEEREFAEEEMKDLVADMVVIEHDENPANIEPREAVMERFRKIKGSGYKVMIKEAVVDERQRKVWVVSDMIRQVEEAQENRELVKERVDMMTFDAEGRLCGIVNSYRRRRRASEED